MLCLPRPKSQVHDVYRVWAQLGLHGKRGLLRIIKNFNSILVCSIIINFENTLSINHSLSRLSKWGLRHCSMFSGRIAPLTVTPLISKVSM